MDDAAVVDFVVVGSDDVVFMPSIIISSSIISSSSQFDCDDNDSVFIHNAADIDVDCGENVDEDEVNDSGSCCLRRCDRKLNVDCRRTCSRNTNAAVNRGDIVTV